MVANFVPSSQNGCVCLDEWDEPGGEPGTTDDCAIAAVTGFGGDLMPFLAVFIATSDKDDVVRHGSREEKMEGREREIKDVIQRIQSVATTPGMSIASENKIAVMSRDIAGGVDGHAVSLSMRFGHERDLYKGRALERRRAFSYRSHRRQYMPLYCTMRR